jgi:hypothetical protein
MECAARAHTHTTFLERPPGRETLTDKQHIPVGRCGLEIPLTPEFRRICATATAAPRAAVPLWFGKESEVYIRKWGLAIRVIGDHPHQCVRGYAKNLRMHQALRCIGREVCSARWHYCQLRTLLSKTHQLFYPGSGSCSTPRANSFASTDNHGQILHPRKIECAARARTHPAPCIAWRRLSDTFIRFRLSNHRFMPAHPLYARTSARHDPHRAGSQH